jgi:hypothetical protein
MPGRDRRPAEPAAAGSGGEVCEDGKNASEADDKPPPKPAGEQLDENAIADALAAMGYHLESVFVRHFKGRQSTTWQDLVKALCGDEDVRVWNTVKTWVNRVKNALLEYDSRCRLSIHTSSRDFRINKQISPE